MEINITAPYNIGDKVFHYFENNKRLVVAEYEVSEIIIDRFGKYLILSNEFGRVGVDYENFGYTLFPTKEEAEEAVKGMVK